MASVRFHSVLGNGSGEFENSIAQLIILAKDGNDDAFSRLVRQYSWLIRARSRVYYLQGAEYEDVLQEAMIGFFKAVRDYSPAKGPFRSFAELCITRQVITAVKTHTRLKHIPLNSARSLDQPLGVDDDRSLVDTLDFGEREQADLQDKRLEVATILRILRKHLTPFQYSTLRLWFEGHSYREIARRLNRHEKAIDNGLTSVKYKVRKLLADGILSPVET